MRYKSLDMKMRLNKDWLKKIEILPKLSAKFMMFNQDPLFDLSVI